MPHFPRVFGVEISFLIALGLKLDIFSFFGSYADVLAHQGGGGAQWAMTPKLMSLVFFGFIGKKKNTPKRQKACLFCA